MFQRTTLKNGLRIITVPQKSSQAVTVLVLVGTGSKYETKDISGISHFLEHMYFKGTKSMPSTTAVAERMDKVGGLFNAFTGEEYTGYFAKVAGEHIKLALDWVADLYLNPILPEKEMEKERGVITEELNMYLDTPIMYIGELWKKLLYGDQPAGWDIVGNKESISSIRREQIKNYMDSQYVAKNTIVCVAGNFDALSRPVEKIVEEYFSGIKATGYKSKSPVIEQQSCPQVLILPKKTDQTHLAFGVRTYNLFHPQKYALEIMETVLGGMMSSRLFLQIREKLGAAYYIKTMAESDPDVGYLASFSGVDNKKVDEAILSILREYKRMTEEKVGISELKKAKDNIKGKLALSLESSDAQAVFYAGQELLEKEILTPKEVYERIDKVSQNDILKVAKDIFRPEKLNLAVIGSFEEDKERFNKLMEI